MKPPAPTYRSTLLISLFLIANCGHVWAAGSANITSVNVSPDLKVISIKCDGPIGKHSAFVIPKPHRLVVDIESTGLGKIPARINVGRKPLNEIRVGYANSRARVVVDFGDHPVPPFKIEKQINAILVNFGNTVPAPLPGAGANLPPKPAPQVQRVPVQPKAVASSPSTPNAASSLVTVKTAGVKDGQVFVELANKKDVKRTYRLVVDLDMERLLVRQASVSDSQGHLKRFDLTASKSNNDTSIQSINSDVGPRRTAGPTATPSEGHPKFKWGIQAGEKRPPAPTKMNAGVPIRVERFEPQPFQRTVAAEER